MTYFREIQCGEELAQFVEKLSLPTTTLAVTEGGLPIQCVRVGGDRKPAIVIKAGNHASEVGGIHAALTLLAEGLDTPHETYVIPCGNPFDFGGYRRALSHASGEAAAVHSDDECLAALKRLGRQFYEGEHFALFRVGEMNFAYVDQKHFDARTLFYGQLDNLSKEDPRLSAELAGRRIFFPNAVYYQEDYGCYDHCGLAGWTSLYGCASNLNRLFDRCDVPVEIQCVREFCERVRPGLALDLHESCINTRIPKELRESGEEIGTHFLILPRIHAPSFEAIEGPVADAMVAATSHRCFTQSQLEAAWGYGDTEYSDGYLRCEGRDNMAFYTWVSRFADAAITVETRMDQPVETRVAQQCAMVRAGLKKYAELKRSV